MKSTYGKITYAYRTCTAYVSYVGYTLGRTLPTYLMWIWIHAVFVYSHSMFFILRFWRRRFIAWLQQQLFASKTEVLSVCLSQQATVNVVR